MYSGRRETDAFVLLLETAFVIVFVFTVLAFYVELLRKPGIISILLVFVFVVVVASEAHFKWPWREGPASLFVGLVVWVILSTAYLSTAYLVDRSRG